MIIRLPFLKHFKNFTSVPTHKKRNKTYISTPFLSPSGGIFFPNEQINTPLQKRAFSGHIQDNFHTKRKLNFLCFIIESFSTTISKASIQSFYYYMHFCIFKPISKLLVSWRGLHEWKTEEAVHFYHHSFRSFVNGSVLVFRCIKEVKTQVMTFSKKHIRCASTSQGRLLFSLLTKCCTDKSTILFLISPDVF